MSAEVLRQAAALIRERAEAATPGPWFALDSNGTFNPSVGTRDASSYDLESREWIAECSPDGDSGGHGVADTVHIASWHPAVALAVADWLDATADDWDRSHAPIPVSDIRIDARKALAVANAYLGADA